MHASSNTGLPGTGGFTECPGIRAAAGLRSKSLRSASKVGLGAGTPHFVRHGVIIFRFLPSQMDLSAGHMIYSFHDSV